MSDGALMFLAWLPFIFIVISMASDDSEALPVRPCLVNGDIYHAESDSDDQSLKTMDRLHERGWSNVRRDEHFFTDDIYADCILNSPGGD